MRKFMVVLLVLVTLGCAQTFQEYRTDGPDVSVQIDNRADDPVDVVLLRPSGAVAAQYNSVHSHAITRQSIAFSRAAGRLTVLVRGFMGEEYLIADGRQQLQIASPNDRIHIVVDATNPGHSKAFIR